MFLIVEIMIIHRSRIGFRFMVFNAPFNNISAISWRSVLLVEETRISGENHRSSIDARFVEHVISTILFSLCTGTWKKVFVLPKSMYRKCIGSMTRESSAFNHRCSNCWNFYCKGYKTFPVYLLVFLKVNFFFMNSCGGGHLGYLIHTQKCARDHQLIKCTVLVQ